MTIEKQPFGSTKAGLPVELYKMKDGGITVEIITYGAAIRAINVPSGTGCRDVALGFDDIAGYEANKAFHGAVIGRIGNRVANARYEMNGKTFELDVNDGQNSLHGGFVGFDKQVWSAKEEADALVLTLLDKEGTAAGYPGDLECQVKYTLADGAFGIEYTAKCTQDTPINLTNHVYFNLAGASSGSITGHKIQIISDAITAVDETLIPTGELMDVTGTAFDLRERTVISKGIDDKHRQIELGGGYDHNWVLSNEERRELTLAAVLECGGLIMECLTTKPGIQFYSGNMMSGETGKDGAVYSKRTGLCLETQYWPNSVNTPKFPASILKKGQVYNHKTVYKFR
ncbi:MAG: galactose mutarotase [Oscillospiraceae bacterium]|nr:galactose mutarotase [Oscillospiraceae bacterium]